MDSGKGNLCDIYIYIWTDHRGFVPDFKAECWWQKCFFSTPHDAHDAHWFLQTGVDSEINDHLFPFNKKRLKIFKFLKFLLLRQLSLRRSQNDVFVVPGLQPPWIQYPLPNHIEQPGILYYKMWGSKSFQPSHSGAHQGLGPRCWKHIVFTLPPCQAMCFQRIPSGCLQLCLWVLRFGSAPSQQASGLRPILACSMEVNVRNATDCHIVSCFNLIIQLNQM